MSHHSGTLFDQIGGAETITKLIPIFYQRVLGDPQLRPFFENSSLDKLETMQAEFFTAALDGPVSYSGLELSWAHQGRGIQRQHFALFVEHLMTTLEEFQLLPDEIEEIIHRISLYIDDITGEAGVDG